MLEKTDLGLVLTPAARQRIQAKLSEPGFQGMIPALMLEEKSPDTWAWRVTYYDNASVAGAEFNTFLLESGGIELIVPQWNFADLIREGSLDWTGTVFTLNGKSELHVARRSSHPPAPHRP